MPRSIRPAHSLLALVGVAALGLATAALTTAPAPDPSPVPSTPVPANDLTVVELFTSQGCSSCPPANANLVTLSRRPDVLALSWGVTYWDQLGWKDTFASDAYTRRQRDYQTGLGNDNVWTPQVVVDGRADVVGQSLPQIQGLIARHRPFTGPTLAFRTVDGVQGIGLGGGTAPTTPADVWLIRYEPHPIQVPVARGENTGRTLPHADVVRELTRLGSWSGQTAGYRLPPATRPGLATAVLVQAPNGGPILSAGRG